MERMAGALLDAQVDLNPHQIDAALFATSNPLSKGAILADEVGLGKTIEAGLLIAQRWAERKRRILVIAPANLRKQWHQELADKFGLAATILEAKSFRQSIKDGVANPFDAASAIGVRTDKIVICSYQFAASKAEAVKNVAWDLVVVDEAHRLRNVYKPDNKTARTLRDALSHAYKVFLTATPLQNSLLELYGLVSFIDDRVFGDLDSFRTQFGQLRDAASFDALKHRISPICKRTLRRQVEAYVKYTRRIPLLRDFTPGDDETRLYQMVSDYLQRDNLYALPNSQRQLITLVLRKLLASSSFAIAGALESLIKRLRQTLDEKVPDALVDELDEDYESLDETAEELGTDGAEDSKKKTVQEIAAIRAEIAELEEFRQLAVSITDNAKGQTLLQALKVAFDRLGELGAAKKAIIFTESRRTQEYLLSLLSRTEYADGVLLFNGSNTDPISRRIYAEWVEQHKGSGRVTGSRTADTRAALVDYFRERGSIMIATEAGAEGINLQFCSLVVNYDLPWNPQRIEQRIGRCHRYGQKHDVVVVNFLNRENDADRRVYELLEQKFRLFDGVFGASDEVLGAVESGVDFERRIADIYQNCRHPEQIHAAFEQLQLDLAGEINDAMLNARKALLENFDEDVQERLKIAKADAETSLDRLERLLMRFTRAMLDGHAKFDGDGLSFMLESTPPFLDGIPNGGIEDIPLGRYELPRRSEDAHVYRLQHPLAQSLLRFAQRTPLEPTTLHLDYEAYGAKVSVLDALRGKAGSTAVLLLRVESLGSTEEYLLAASITGTQLLDAEVTEKLLALPGRVENESCVNVPQQQVMSTPELAETEQVSLEIGNPNVRLPDPLKQELSRQKATVIGRIEQRNLTLFADESEKLDAWADDLKIGLEREIKELDRAIKECRTKGKGAATLAEKLDHQKEQRALESARDKKRRELFERQDEIQRRRDLLIEELEVQLQQQVSLTMVLEANWTLE
ncbi:SNF2-related protein [Noviherbaspirillum sp.]|uniref:SNF2-related protein n=1 Tax=Noviherbaspirillum sp. TaxID=1926288 RepID=UPI002B48F6B6|nr:SNF2-related protein [Noviherbaspirillum sp.]HJV81334.1 SNF2-related protein [Noviherbaspirillum sp.]